MAVHPSRTQAPFPSTDPTTQMPRNFRPDVNADLNTKENPRLYPHFVHCSQRMPLTVWRSPKGGLVRVPREADAALARAQRQAVDSA